MSGYWEPLFNLKAYSDEHQQTTLVRGAVEVLLDKQQVLLHPGEQVTCIDKELRVEQVDVRPYIAWKNERFVFENEPLEAVLKKIGTLVQYNGFYSEPEIKTDAIYG